jgi:Tol biopolymer transport system component
VTTNAGNDFAPSWFPDDRRLLFHSSRTGNREVYSVAVDGTDERRLTHASVHLLMPELSPDGTRIVAFAVDATKPSRAAASYNVLISQDGTGQWSAMRRLTPNDESAIWARWSPDGRWIAYVEPVVGIVGRLRITPAAGGASRVVYDGLPGEAVSYLAWGKDANVLFFGTQEATARRNFYRISLNGGKPRLLFRDDPDHRIGRADFATDGRRLFVTFAADESDVFAMELNR